MSTKRSLQTPRSLADLPPSILIEIIVRLPLRTIFVIKSVCKIFLYLTTPNPHFTALHASNAAQILLFQFRDVSSPSYVLRSAEPELGVSTAQISELKPLFQLPKMGTSVNLYGTKFREGNKFFLVNSCNGLVFFGRRLAGDERSLVCNPVTNEYILIPEVDPKIRVVWPAKSMWLGFSRGADQYKVLRILDSVSGDIVEVAAQVFVIGSDSWRHIDDVPLSRHITSDMCSALVNGLLYWLDLLWRDIVYFDFEREKFGEVALPHDFRKEAFREGHYTSIGVLGGNLCLSCNDFGAQRVYLWVSRNRGDQDSWRKEFVVNMVRLTGGPIHGHFNPLQFLRNGELLMLWNENYLVFYDPRTKILRFFRLLRNRLTPKVVALTPSFVSLKDTLKVEKVLSRNVRPRRCALYQRFCADSAVASAGCLH